MPIVDRCASGINALILDEGTACVPTPQHWVRDAVVGGVPSGMPTRDVMHSVQGLGADARLTHQPVASIKPRVIDESDSKLESRTGPIMSSFIILSSQ